MKDTNIKRGDVLQHISSSYLYRVNNIVKVYGGNLHRLEVNRLNFKPNSLFMVADIGTEREIYTNELYAYKKVSIIIIET